MLTNYKGEGLIRSCAIKLRKIRKQRRDVFRRILVFLVRGKVRCTLLGIIYKFLLLFLTNLSIPNQNPMSARTQSLRIFFYRPKSKVAVWCTKNTYIFLPARYIIKTPRIISCIICILASLCCVCMC